MYLQSRKHHFGDNLWQENVFGLAASSWRTHKAAFVSDRIRVKQDLWHDGALWINLVLILGGNIKKKLNARTECDTTKTSTRNRESFSVLENGTMNQKSRQKIAQTHNFSIQGFKKLHCGCLFIAKTLNVAHTKTHTDTNIQKHTHRFQSGNTKKWRNLAKLVLKTFKMTFVTSQHNSLCYLNRSFFGVFLLL